MPIPSETLIEWVQTWLILQTALLNLYLTGFMLYLFRQAYLGEIILHGLVPGIVLGTLISVPLGWAGGYLSGALLLILFTGWRHTLPDTTVRLSWLLAWFFGLGALAFSWLNQSALPVKSIVWQWLTGTSFIPLRETLITNLIFFIAQMVILLAGHRLLLVHAFASGTERIQRRARWLITGLLPGLWLGSLLAGMQVVGFLLAGGMLFLPVILAHLWALPTARWQHLFLLGFAFVLAGGTPALLIETTVGGSASVWTLIIWGVLLVGYSLWQSLFGKKGYLRRTILHVRMLWEDFLLWLLRREEHGMHEGKWKDFARQLSTPFWSGPWLLTPLIQQGLIRQRNGYFRLTPRGRTLARYLLLRHRLLEIYLVQQGVRPEQVHHYAEWLEHWLPEELTRQLRQWLQEVREDPHGRPLPWLKQSHPSTPPSP